MNRICARHELRMLGLAVSSLHPTADRGLRSAEHARLLGQIARCPRCRRRRGGVAEPTTRVTVTFALPEEVDPLEVATAVEEVLPDYVEEVVIRVA
ncbi:hypothetical protein [Nocardioides sp.]|uniref:hypothetical protein n=1 Tax=Nocardioides sp. TaxID=35761 RepID=UPI002ED80F7E